MARKPAPKGDGSGKRKAPAEGPSDATPQKKGRKAPRSPSPAPTAAAAPERPKATRTARTEATPSSSPASRRSASKSPSGKPPADKTPADKARAGSAPAGNAPASTPPTAARSQATAPKDGPSAPPSAPPQSRAPEEPLRPTPRPSSAPAPTPPPAPRPRAFALPPDEEGWEPLVADATFTGTPSADTLPGALPPTRLALPPDEEGWVPLVGEAMPRPAHPARTIPSPTSPAIPPLPDGEWEELDEFEPLADGEDAGDDEGSDDDDDLPRTPPAGATPRQIYDAVRAGDLHVSCLDALTDDVVAALVDDVGLEVREGERRAETLYRLLHHQPEAPEPPTYATEGLLELVPEGFGFLRSLERGYYVGPFDAYVPVGVIRRLGLRPGHWVTGTARAPKPGERYPTLVHVEEVNHEDPAAIEGVPAFDSLVVTHPDRRYVLETDRGELAMRVVDLFCPLGRGQRALIVSPPRAGKTILLQKIADSIATNYPEVEIVVLLVDERPEEVTHMRRTVRGEVIASTFDQPPERHIRVAELAIEKVKRLVELRRHVVLLIDSLTRLGRAYNNESGGTGRLLTGGLEATALTSPKRFFGAARNIEHGGSLTIVASALVDTGSRLDQVIFEEFKGTGNMEIVLSRDIANQRVWPAIDVTRSGTRREDLLLHPDEQRRVTALRREIGEMDPAEAMIDIRERMEKHRTNAELLMRLSIT